MRTRRDSRAARVRRDGTRWCGYCEQWLPSDGFDTPVGSQCTSCKKIRGRGHRESVDTRTAPGALSVGARRALAAGIKARAGCTDCGRRDGRLDFDHLPGHEKAFNISWAVARPREVGDLELLAEMEKCEVVCVACHVKRTTDRLAVTEMEAS